MVEAALRCGAGDAGMATEDGAQAGA